MGTVGLSTAQVQLLPVHCTRLRGRNASRYLYISFIMPSESSTGGRCEGTSDSGSERLPLLPLWQSGCTETTYCSWLSDCAGASVHDSIAVGTFTSELQSTRTRFAEPLYCRSSQRARLILVSPYFGHLKQLICSRWTIYSQDGLIALAPFILFRPTTNDYTQPYRLHRTF